MNAAKKIGWAVTVAAVTAVIVSKLFVSDRALSIVQRTDNTSRTSTETTEAPNLIQDSYLGREAQREEPIVRSGSRVPAEETSLSRAVTTLLVTVAALDGTPIPASIELRPARGRKSKPIAQADIRGREGATLPVNGPGVIFATIYDYTQGYTPPPSARQQIFYPEDHASFELKIGLDHGENTLHVSLPAAARIKGVVCDSRGIGIQGALVCVQHTSPGRVKDYYSKTDSRGKYEIVCPPGRVRACVRFLQTHPSFTLARPLPENLDLLEGELAEINFSVGNSSSSISGYVLDQSEQPVGDIDVLCYFRPDESHLEESVRGTYTIRDYIHSTKTDKDGRFALTGLPAGRFGLKIGAEDYQPIGKGRLGMLVPTQFFAVPFETALEIDNTSVFLSRPFGVTIQILSPDGSRARPDQMVGWSGFAVLQKSERRKRIVEDAVRITATDGFAEIRWSCETPEEGVLFELRGPGGAIVQETIWPIPGEEITRSIQLDPSFPK